MRHHQYNRQDESLYSLMKKFVVEEIQGNDFSSRHSFESTMVKLCHWYDENVPQIEDDWIIIDEDNTSSMPPEGVDVLVSDGINYDTAYCVYSGGIEWLKTSVKNDTSEEFDDFTVIKWKDI